MCVCPLKSVYSTIISTQPDDDDSLYPEVSSITEISDSAVTWDPPAVLLGGDNGERREEGVDEIAVD